MGCTFYFIFKQLKTTSTASIMEEFAVTAAGHSFVGLINQQRIQSLPALKSNDHGATIVTLYQT